MASPAARTPATAAPTASPAGPAPGGAWLELYIPCIVFAHIFAAIWLLIAYFKMMPQHAVVVARHLGWVRSSLAGLRSWWVKRGRRQQPDWTAAAPAAGGAAAAMAAPAPAATLPASTAVMSMAAAASIAATAPGAAAPASLAEAGGAPNRRLWLPPTPPTPSAGTDVAAATDVDTETDQQESIPSAKAGGGAAAAAAAAPFVVPRRWTAIGSPAADKSSTASTISSDIPAAAIGGGDVGASAGAAPSGPATMPAARRTATHSVSFSNNAAIGGSAAGSFPARRLAGPGIARHSAQLLAAMAAQGAARPDPRVMRRMSSTVRRITIEWSDLGCEYDTASGPRTVLKGVYGRAAPGDLLGLLGPSGAGKSTLLDVLAARKRVGRLSGSVMVDGAPRDDDAFVRRSAYVPQDDHFLPTLTAGEALSFHAALVLPGAMSPAGRRKRCAEVLSAMGLGRQGGTLVGGTLPGGLVLRGLSGGERKRLAIATGIVAAPSALLLDEPTSGLDAAAALGVMQYMRALAEAGHVVLASVHQPRAAIWGMFTQVVVLSRGRMMYSGHCAGAVPWFTQGLGYCYDPQRHGVASDWIMDLVNTTFKKPRRVYGRMMTGAADVDRAADAFLVRYLDQARRAAADDAVEAAEAEEESAALQQLLLLRGQGQQSQQQHLELAPAGVPDAGAGRVYPPPPSQSFGECTPLSSMIAHRGSGEGSNSGVHPRGRLGLTTPLPPPPAAPPSLTPEEGGGGAEAHAKEGQGGRASTAAGTSATAAASGGSGIGGLWGGARRAALGTAGCGSVSASAGSPALLPTTPRTVVSFSGDGGGGGGGAGRGSSGGGAAADVAASGGTPAAPVVAAAAAQPARRGILRFRRRDNFTFRDGSDGGGNGGGEGVGGAGGAATDSGAAAAAAARAATAVAAWSAGKKGADGGGGGGDGWRADPQQRPPGWLRQVRILAWRELLAVTRNPADVAGRMLIFCWVAVVVGLIFYGLGAYFESMRSRMDVMFIEVCVLLLLPYVYMSLYTSDKQYYTADLSAKLYSPSAYYVAKVLAVLPFSVLSMLVFCLTIYGMSGLRRSGMALVEHAVMATLAYLCGSQVLYAAAVATPNQDTAFMVAIAWTAVNILMSNYLIRYKDMDQYWLSVALRWFSVMSWAFQGMAGAEFRGQAYGCSKGFGTDVLSYLPAYLPGNPALHPENYLQQLLGTPARDCTVDTNRILSYFGMGQPFWRLAVILLGYLAVLHVITFAALKLTAGRERR